MATNVVVISGRLTRDAELKHVKEYALVQFTLAFDKGYKERKHPCFVDCKWWGKGAEAINQYLVKGKQVTVTGSWDVETWTGNDGQQKRKDLIDVSSVELGANARSDGNGADRPDFSEPPMEAFAGGDIPF